jgi:hypothetical protein
MEVVLLLIGICIGIALTKLFGRKRPIGTLRIDRSDPSDEPYLFADLDVPIHNFCNEKTVLMKVSNENYVSHK